MDSAVKAIELALELRADNAYTAYNAASFYIRAGLPEKAEQVYGPAYAEAHKEDAQALALYASFWSRQKKHPESLAAAEAAVRLKPDDPNILQMAAQSALAWGKEDLALAMFGPAAVAKIGDNAVMLNNYAWFWAQLGKNLESALAAVERSIVLLGLGRLDEALAAVNKAMGMSTTPSRYKDTEKKIKDAIAKRDQKK
jgi:Tfp pilus assembly protein PilF